MKHAAADSSAIEACPKAGGAYPRDMIEIGGDAIAEFHGLYGPYQVRERLLQKIWLQGAFNQEEIRTTEGERLEVCFPGRWNLLGGPDFKDARLVIGGKAVNGDVEIHFRADDWRAHGHDRDSAYNAVKLHVVLFPPAVHHPEAVTADGRIPPTLVLMDLLWYDLEQYADDDALEQLSGRSSFGLTEGLLLLPLEDRLARVGAAAASRWERKVHFMRLRVERWGWMEACHLTALDVLGYRLNRAGMLAVGARFPLERWVVERPTADVLLAAGAARWTRQGVRPANYPERRVRQYGDWLAAAPDWPRRLNEIAGNRRRAPRLTGHPATVWQGIKRRELDLKSLREAFERIAAGGHLGRPRFDTLAVDGFFPLMAVNSGIDWFPFWFHWYPGDAPAALKHCLQLAEVAGTRSRPLANGWIQGALSLNLELGARPEKPSPET